MCYSWSRVHAHVAFTVSSECLLPDSYLVTCTCKNTEEEVREDGSLPSAPLKKMTVQHKNWSCTITMCMYTCITQSNARQMVGRQASKAVI